MASNIKVPVLPSTALSGASNIVAGSETTQNGQVDPIFYLRVTAIDASATLTAKVQHSPDNVNWFDLVAFTAVAGAVSTELKVPTVPVLTYLRANMAMSGTTKTATAQIDGYFRKQQ